MQSHLSLLLTRQYPELYGPDDGKHGFPFAHHDGWFGILDALSEVVVWRARVDGRPPQRIQQVKEKLGTLRFYFGSAEADDGAIDMAEEMSGRLCEVTGQPGRLGSRRGWRATRAPGLDGIQFPAPEVGEDGRMGVPPLGMTVADVRRWRADVLAPAGQGSAGGTLDVPEGWLDLSDGLLRQLSMRQGVFRTSPAGTIVVSPGRADHGDAIPVRVNRVGVGSSGVLQVDHVGGGLYAEGVIAMAVALSRRLSAVTGASETKE